MRKVVFALAMIATVAFTSCGTGTDSTPTVTDTAMAAPAPVDTVTVADTVHVAVDSTSK
jgi:hypothetical protein